MSDDNANVGDNGANESTMGFGGVDRSSLVIEEQNDDGFNVPVAEDHMFTFLGLRDDDERPMETTSLNDTSVDATIAHGASIDGTNKTNYEDVDIEGAAIPVDDRVSEEENIDYDMDSPNMEEGDTFPSMEAFRVAVKQYGIMGEFDIETLRSEPGRFEGICKAEGCKWKIKAKKVQHEGAIMVTNVGPDHYCLTRSRKPSSMASQSWIAERALPILRKKPETSATELLEKLEEDYGITLKYWTVWKARERAMSNLYGTWEESFQLLYSFKAEIALRSPGSVVQIDTKNVDGEVYFNRFFIALKPCIDGFLSGCRPYISIDSTHLNGKWNGQLATATALDGHNWMFPIAFGFFDAETTENWTWKSRSKKNTVPWDRASTSKDGNPSTPTSPGPITRSQSVRNLSQPPTSPGPVTRSQAARSPFTPMRTDTSAQPSISPGPITRSQFALFGNGGSQSAFPTPPARTPTKSKTTTAKKITPRKRRIN